MKWKNHKYSYLKEVIFEIIRKELDTKDAERITVKTVHDSIDKFFELLLTGSIEHKLGENEFSRMCERQQKKENQ